MEISKDRMNEILRGFGIGAICVDSEHYNNFKTFDLRLNPGTKIRKIESFAKEIALSLRSYGSPIVKTMTSDGVVQLQVLSNKLDTIPLYSSLNTLDKPDGMFLPFYIGDDQKGDPFWIDMVDNPHLLVAGATGSGKSVFLHNIIANASSSKNTELYLIDTKMVEFGSYKNSNPKIVKDVAFDYDSAITMINYLCSLMDYRYSAMSLAGISSLDGCFNLFNKIIVVIDEIADLMSSDKKKAFQGGLNKLAAKSRACGIYLVIATQRPSVSVVNGDIKANFPGRVSCKVSSRFDSQTIIGQSGAESLMGKGDALFSNPKNELTRIQIAFTTSNEVLQNIRL